MESKFATKVQEVVEKRENAWIALKQKGLKIIDRHVKTLMSYTGVTSQSELLIPNNLESKIKEELRSLMEEGKVVDRSVYEEILSLVNKERTSVMNKIFMPSNSSVDNELKVANALGFLNMHGTKLTDTEASSILKDFENNYEIMKQFRDGIRNKVDIYDENGLSKFPKTFGKVDLYDKINDMFNDIEEFSKVALLTGIGPRENVKISNKLFTIPSETINSSYLAINAIYNLKDYATHIDEVMETEVV